MKIKPILIFVFIFSLILSIPFTTTADICKVCHPAIFKMKKGEYNDIFLMQVGQSNMTMEGIF